MENTIGIGQAAGMLGITVKTLQRWEREGRRVPMTRTASNRRRYTESQLRAFLRNQRRVLEEFTAVRGLAGVEFVEGVDGGLDFGRKRFLAMMDANRRQLRAVLESDHAAGTPDSH